MVARTPGLWHLVKIAYNKAAAPVRWLLDNREVFCVDRIGQRIDRRYLTIDHGGEETLVSPNQLDGGMGLFTLLDGFRPSTRGLVRLSNVPGFYYDPATGAPAPAGFFADETSSPGSRLFGQGAERRMRTYVDSSLPVAP
jgi:hypothetical protein